MKPLLFLIPALHFIFSSGFAQADTAAKRLNDYREQVVQVFNSCTSHDEQIIKAIRAKDGDRIESGRTALLQCANDGINRLHTMQSFNGDASLKFSAKEALMFYKRLALYDLPQVKDYLMAEQKFVVIKKDFKNKPAKKVSVAEIYAYNNEIKKYNEAVTRYTQLNNFMAANRKLTFYNWNATLKIFTNGHMNYMLKNRNSQKSD